MGLWRGIRWTASAATTRFRPVSHVLFDMDGVIIDTEHIYEKIVATIANKYGKSYPRDVRLQIMGTTEQRTSEIACKELKLPITPQQFHIQMKELGNQMLRDAPLMKGSKRLIEHLYASNVPIALATSSGKESVEAKTLNYLKLFDSFHHKVMGSSDSEVKFGKPHPDIFLICASRFPENPNPENCLVFEDAPNGVEAALAAGMQVVMVPDPTLEKSLTKRATLLLNTLEEFKPEEFGLPPFKS
ncbi:putative pseudouridine-5'-phosphatase [Arctopsyche grandis]|uniref:putative pseudouridine-5'-phosphatase n=1 Tax=Arctopsyche grandis TaxID=121162 RepID=UPI00406D695F